MPSNRVRAALVAAAAFVAVAGCATPPTATSENREQPLYRTGSNLPVKEGQRTGVIVAKPDDVAPRASMPMPPSGMR